MEQTSKLLLRSSSSADTTPEVGLLLGHALSQEYSKVVVGMDLMKSSMMMKNALIAGLISSGTDVIDIGVVSEPAAAYAARMGDCCVYVTEFRQLDLMSGYLLIDKDGSFFGIDQIRHLEMVSERPKKNPDYKSLGSVKEYYNATVDYSNLLKKTMMEVSGGAMILNCNCGLATESAPQILNTIGTDIICINAQKDRDFISNSLSTRETDIRHMRALVEASPGSVGVSINRIGTLMRVFDESGDFLSDEQVLAMLILYLKPRRIVVPMNMTWMIPDVFAGKVDVGISTPFPDPNAEEAKVIFAPPSAGAIHKAMAQNDADLGFYRGGYVFRDLSLSPDAIYASIVLSQFSANNSLRDAISKLPEYFREEKTYKISCSHEDFIRMMNATLPEISPTKTYEAGYWRVEMPGGGFFISFDKDQEDEVYVFAESNDKLYLISLLEVIDNLMKTCEAGQ